MIKKEGMSHITISGNIGAGKTYLTNELGHQVPDALILEEPVETNPFLQPFYADKRRWGFGMQIYMLNHRYRQHKNIPSDCIVFQDRFINEDMVFMDTLYKEGNIYQIEYEAYKDLSANMLENLKIPDLIVYLRVPPEVSMRRVMQRARGCEVTGVTLPYLRDLYNAYEHLMNEMAKRTKVIVIENDPFCDPRVVLQQISSEIGFSIGTF